MIPPAKNGDFVAKMEYVLDVYKRPYNKEFPVVCMDETPKQLVRTKSHSLPMKPGNIAKVDYEYIREGMANIFMANEPLTGKCIIETTQTKTKKDWANYLRNLSDTAYPGAKKISLVMDNYATHSATALYETFLPEEAWRIWNRFEFVYTPIHGSWLNMAEIELQILKRQCLNRHIYSITELQHEVNAWQLNRNSIPHLINWQFTTKDARIKLKRLYPSF